MICQIPLRRILPNNQSIRWSDRYSAFTQSPLLPSIKRIIQTLLHLPVWHIFMFMFTMLYSAVNCVDCFLGSFTLILQITLLVETHSRIWGKQNFYDSLKASVSSHHRISFGKQLHAMGPRNTKAHLPNICCLNFISLVCKIYLISWNIFCSSIDNGMPNKTMYMLFNTYCIPLRIRDRSMWIIYLYSSQLLHRL